MAKTLHFELVSPERLLMECEVTAVVVPGSEGDFMVYPDHAPVITTIRPGVVEVIGASDKDEIVRLFIHGGFAEVGTGHLVILAEEAIPVSELRKADIEQKIINAREDLEDARTDEQTRTAQEAISKLTELMKAAA